MLFGGNLLRQPAFVQLRREHPLSFRLLTENNPGADRLMNESIFIGTYPGLTKKLLDYVILKINEFVEF